MTRAGLRLVKNYDRRSMKNFCRYVLVMDVSQVYAQPLDVVAGQAPMLSHLEESSACTKRPLMGYQTREQD